MESTFPLAYVSGVLKFVYFTEILQRAHSYVKESLKSNDPATCDCHFAEPNLLILSTARELCR